MSQQFQFELIMTAVKIFGGLVALGLVLFGLARTVGAPQRAPATVIWEAERPQPVALPADMAVGPDAMTAAAGTAPGATGPAAPMGLPVPEAELRRLEEERLRAEAEERTQSEREAQQASLQEMARTDPDRLAEVLQIWLSEDRRS